MNSNTEIANTALVEVGASVITDLDTDTTKNGDIVRRWYKHTRDALLRSYSWNFALARQDLTKDVTSEGGGEFTNSYTLPTNPYCLRALEIYDSGSTWKLKGRKLLTDDSTVHLKYISRVTNVVDFDDLFTDAFIYKLASAIAWPITRNRVLAGDLQSIYLEKAQMARTADSQEGTPDYLVNNSLIWPRFGSTGISLKPATGPGTPR